MKGCRLGIFIATLSYQAYLTSTSQSLRYNYPQSVLEKPFLILSTCGFSIQNTLVTSTPHTNKLATFARDTRYLHCAISDTINSTGTLLVGQRGESSGHSRSYSVLNTTDSIHNLPPPLRFLSRHSLSSWML